MPKLIYANTKDSNMFYAVRTGIREPFFFIDTGQEQYIFLDMLEYEAFKEKNKNIKLEPVLINKFYKETEEVKDKTSFANKLAFVLLSEYGLLEKVLEVPSNFPVAMADYLRLKGFNLDPRSPFWTERAVKSKDEVDAIKKSLEVVRKAFLLVEEILQGSVVEGDFIKYRKEILTSEFMKNLVEKFLFENNMLSTDGLIISTGNQTAFPHHQGSGPILANRPIVCDIFPKSHDTGYFADMTRTYVKGAPSKDVEKMHATVLAAQELIIKSVRPGMPGKELTAIGLKFFKDSGYETEENKGFIHSAGHGLGLDVHEAPAMGMKSEDILRPGQVITIEPGLYYPEKDGVRIEDMVLITENGAENLTNFQKEKYIF